MDIKTNISCYTIEDILGQLTKSHITLRLSK